jgi:DNA-binding transcriptional ArsR family regulator
MPGSVRFVQKFVNIQNVRKVLLEEAGVGSGRSAEVRRFVEGLANALTLAGVPRMPARVFVQLLATDDGRLTAAELADQLLASPAAISGAVRYLMQVGLLTREREPGSRRDHYVVQDDAWYHATVRRDQLLAGIVALLDAGIEALGPGPAAGRLAESRAFFAFVEAEMPLLLERWERAKGDLVPVRLRPRRQQDQWSR